MSIENLSCFGCGGKGHVERECPNRQLASGPMDKPMWCGVCDRRTRLIESHGLAARCPQCHPLGHLNLAQHIRCPGCRMLVYAYDTNECGKHASPVQPADRRPEREEIDAIVARETEARINPKDAA